MDVVTDIIKNSFENNFAEPPEELAAEYAISTRTLHRYFEAATGISTKQALQIMRIRKALSAYVAPNVLITHQPVFKKSQSR